MTIYSDMEVEYIDGYGSDILVVNAARVSFHKRSNYVGYYEQPLDVKNTNHPLYPNYERYVKNAFSKVNNGIRNIVPIFPENLISFNDFRLIHFLARKKHWTPFGHGSFTFRIKAPIFVARQLGKHQTGLVWNEVSRRYYDGPVELYKMDYKKASGDKRQEGEGFIDADPRITEHEKLAIEIYNDMLAKGAAAEDIRSVLPQNMMTEWYWSGSIAAFMRIVGLRTKLDTQRQTRVVANFIADILKDKVPVSYLAHFEDDDAIEG